MDRELINEKIESLRRCVRRIEERCPDDVERLHNDPDLQDIVSLNLIRAVQLCVDIAAHVVADSDEPAPSTMAASFDSLVSAERLSPELADAMKAAVGFRNIAVHSYQEIDWDIVFRICHDKMVDFRGFAQAVVSLY